MTTRRLDHEVLIIGAGFGGMGAAIALRRCGVDRIAIVDREDDLGGTWHVNHYPGLAVDIASVTYSYSFAPNPYWKYWFARGPELKQYATYIAERFQLRELMEFGLTATAARWDAAGEFWEVTLEQDGEPQTRRARYLMTATGFLSQPQLPDIDGIEEFAGTIVHTADWDHELELTNQRIGVIGTGATAVQLIPQIAQRARELTVYQRTPIWVTPKTDFKIPGLVQQAFAAVPLTQKLARRVNSWWLEGMMVTGVLHYRQAKALNSAAALLAKAHLRRQVPDPILRQKLTPQYSFGCKRPTFSNDYYPTFTQPHVRLETTPIAQVTPTGITTEDGNHIELDIVVAATGFNLWEQNFPAFEIIGRDGIELGQSWREDGYHAYQGVSVHGFPNFISLNSPYSYSGLSYFMTIEMQMGHIKRLFREMQYRDCTVFEVREQADQEFWEQMRARMDDTVFTQGDCGGSRSYYFTPKGDAVLLRPTNTAQARKAVATFNLNDYAYA